DNQIRIWDVRQARSSYVIPAHTSLVSQVRFWHAGDGFESRNSADSGRGEPWRFDGPPPCGRRNGRQRNGAGGGDDGGMDIDVGDGANGGSDGSGDSDDDDDSVASDEFDPSAGWRRGGRRGGGFGIAGARDSSTTALRRQLLSGGHLVSSSFDGTCKIFTEGDWKPIKALAGLDSRVLSCDVSGDGLYIATVSYDRTFKLFSPGA
ncbi:hypothetical protein HK405_002653, partial [Cladochytrium tenue]